MVIIQADESAIKQIALSVKKTKENFQDYSDNATIHGIRYLGEHKRPLVEKIWWIIAFLISISICATFIITIYEKWDKEPVIVSFESETMPLHDIPFPAVTLCPEIRSLSEIFNYTDAIIKIQNDDKNINDILDKEDKFHLESLMHICAPEFYLNQIHRFKNISTADHVEDIFTVSVPIKSSILNCAFGGVKMSCADIFTELLTEDGICFNFNLIQAREIFKKYTVQHDYEFLVNRESKVLDWNYDTGYAKNSAKQSYPFRANRQGTQGGLEVTLGFSMEQPDYKCGGFSSRGFKILLHAPNEFPKFQQRAFDIHMNKDGFITVFPEVVSVSPGLRDYSPERRKCYFADERFLYYYKTYTQWNCEQECLSNYTLVRCGCVKFSLPRKEDTVLCGVGKIKCYLDAKSDFDKFMFEGNNDLTKTCKCLPNCNFVEYYEQFLETEINWQGFLAGFSEDVNKEDIRRSRLTVSFDRKEVISILRSERYGLSDFISNCGGLLGLFMGISILSVVEIIYYCTIRLICNLRRKRDEEEEEEEQVEIPSKYKTTSDTVSEYL